MSTPTRTVGPAGTARDPERGGQLLTRTFFLWIAAKAALRRKKAHEHSLEQTQAQIGTLEQQINAIESANINRETLAAMERAGEAMKQIHGKLTPEKVDETMWVPGSRVVCWARPPTADVRAYTGTSFGSRTRSARRSSARLRTIPSARLWTMPIWRRSWRPCSRNSWMSLC